MFSYDFVDDVFGRCTLNINTGRYGEPKLYKATSIKTKGDDYSVILDLYFEYWINSEDVVDRNVTIDDFIDNKVRPVWSAGHSNKLGIMLGNILEKIVKGFTDIHIEHFSGRYPHMVLQIRGIYNDSLDFDEDIKERLKRMHMSDKDMVEADIHDKVESGKISFDTLKFN